MGTSITSRDGTTIAFDRSGDGSSLILVDGALSYRGFGPMGALAARLAENFTVFTYDRRGRGESGDTQPYSVRREIEDIEALIEKAGAPAFLHGFSSGAVLALRATAQLGEKVSRLAVLEPPFDADGMHPKAEFFEYKDQMLQLIKAGKNGEAVAYFLQDLVPPDVLEGIKRSPDWPVMEALAPTLAYDNEVMGDGMLPTEAAAAVTAPTLILDGGESPDFKHAAADALAAAMPHARRKTFEGEMTLVPAEVLAPALTVFFRQPVGRL